MKRDQRDLLAKAGNGDMAAFAELMEPMRSYAFAVACRLVGESNADDVVMNAYLKAWRAIPQFKGNASLKTWLYRITYNCGIDFLRSVQRRKETMLSELEHDDARPVDLPDMTAAAPDQELARSELSDMIESAMRQLSPEHRTTLTLRFADGLSYAEIAEVTGVNIGTVMSRIFNGRKKLQQLLGSADSMEQSR